MSVPSAAYPASRWDALMDVFFHTMQLPQQDATGWYPQVDLQIIQSQVDSGYYAAMMASHHAFNITLGGNRYSAVIDTFGPFNQSGGHTITMFSRPNAWADGTGTFWGATSQTHDLQAIINYWLQSHPVDDNGNPIKNGAGTTVTAPLLNPAWYLTAVNGDFEIDYGDGLTPWITNDFWVAVQNEPDGN